LGESWFYSFVFMSAAHLLRNCLYEVFMREWFPERDDCFAFLDDFLQRIVIWGEPRIAFTRTEYRNNKKLEALCEWVILD